MGVDSPKQCQSVAGTYTAVIAVRYPELDNVQNDLICFGNCLLGEQATSGGFLPLFWDAPSAYMHAATDIGSAVDWLQSQVELNSDENGCLAVLHNRNKMVATFGNSEWVTQSDGAVQSKSVTSCAGMTAHYVLLAQTKVGFLSGGRGRHMKELSENEVLAQLEEAYARATVALTRAQKLCIIMGPLDMRGLPGAATVIGCLKYGAGVCGVHDSNQAAEVFLKDGSLNDGPVSLSNKLCSLVHIRQARRSCALLSKSRAYLSFCMGLCVTQTSVFRVVLPIPSRTLEPTRACLQ